jgi:amidase
MDVSRRSLLGSAAGIIAAGGLPTVSTAKSAKPNPSNPDLDFASAGDAATAIASRRISSVELTRRMLERIGKFNPRINAIVNILSESALQEAQDCDAALARRESPGPLLGVPIVIKDAFEIAGVRTTAGADFLANHIPQKDSEVVRRLRQAGAVVLGNTNVPFMLQDGQSYNRIYGTTNNPWDLARTPGGSSGGSAAALASGLAYLSPGSDIAGSIRQPANLCGIYGHKPTFNVVPQRGHIPPPPGVSSPELYPTLPVAGPLARTAEDLMVAMRVLGGPDGPEALAYRWELPAPRRQTLAQYRVGFVLDDPLSPVEEPVREALARAVSELEKAGVKLVEGWPKGVDSKSQYETYRYIFAAFNAGNIPEDQLPRVRAVAARNDGSLDSLVAQAAVDPHRRYQEFSARQVKARQAWQEAFRDIDVFLMPNMSVTAFPHDHSEPADRRQIMTSRGPVDYKHTCYFWISFANLTGLPATAAPVGIAQNGLPVDIQILGPFAEDSTPIDFAVKLAELIGGFVAPQGYA